VRALRFHRRFNHRDCNRNQCISECCCIRLEVCVVFTDELSYKDGHCNRCYLIAFDYKLSSSAARLPCLCGGRSEPDLPDTLRMVHVAAGAWQSETVSLD
jgi:hypothetical protein